jgi:hypothetical protein
LTRRALETEAYPDGLGLADRMLSELAEIASAPATVHPGAASEAKATIRR